MDYKYKGYLTAVIGFNYFVSDQGDRQEDDAIESVTTDSDDCIVSSPISKDVKQVSRSIYGNYLVSLRKIFSA